MLDTRAGKQNVVRREGLPISVANKFAAAIRNDVNLIT
jgi:hypothetical protein